MADTQYISKITAGVTTYDIADAWVREQLTNLQVAGIKFIGKTTTLVKDGDTTSPVAIVDKGDITPAKGDFVIRDITDSDKVDGTGTLEFIWDGTAWRELGSTGKLHSLAFNDQISYEKANATTGAASKSSITAAGAQTANITNISYTPVGTVSKPGVTVDNTKTATVLTGGTVNTGTKSVVADASLAGDKDNVLTAASLTGAVTLGGSTTLTGTTTFLSGASLTGSVSLTGAVELTGTTTLTGDTTVLTGAALTGAYQQVVSSLVATEHDATNHYCTLTIGTGTIGLTPSTGTIGVTDTRGVTDTHGVSNGNLGVSTGTASVGLSDTRSVGNGTLGVSTTKGSVTLTTTPIDVLSSASFSGEGYTKSVLTAVTAELDATPSFTGTLSTLTASVSITADTIDIDHTHGITYTTTAGVASKTTAHS